MSETAFSLEPFKKALYSLRAVLAESKNEFIRDSAIKRFEYTFELSWKSLKRYLELTSPNSADIDGMTYQELIRTGAEQGLIEDVASWLGARRNRNLTSHTYNESTAELIYNDLAEFLKDAEFLFKALERKAKEL